MQAHTRLRHACTKGPRGSGAKPRGSGAKPRGPDQGRAKVRAESGFGALSMVRFRVVTSPSFLAEQCEQPSMEAVKQGGGGSMGFPGGSWPRKSCEMRGACVRAGFARDGWSAGAMRVCKGNAHALRSAAGGCAVHARRSWRLRTVLGITLDNGLEIMGIMPDRDRQHGIVMDATKKSWPS